MLTKTYAAEIREKIIILLYLNSVLHGGINLTLYFYCYDLVTQIYAMDAGYLPS